MTGPEAAALPLHEWEGFYVIVGTSAAALSLESMTPLALLVVGGASVLLVLIGIHNAWDTVTYLIQQRMQREQEKTEK